jgi:hypothetical protein
LSGFKHDNFEIFKFFPVEMAAVVSASGRVLHVVRARSVVGMQIASIVAHPVSLPCRTLHA